MPFAVSDVVTRRLVPTNADVDRLPKTRTDWRDAVEANQRLGGTIMAIEQMVGHPILLAFWEAPR